MQDINEKLFKLKDPEPNEKTYINAKMISIQTMQEQIRQQDNKLDKNIYRMN